MYAFDPHALRDLALKHVGKPVPQIARDLEHDLASTYPELIHLDMPWVLNPAGFVMYQVKMLFARANEYIGIMGVPIPSTGHTGRHPVTYYDTILAGGTRNAKATDLVATPVEAGDFVVTRPWESFSVHVPEFVFFLEYCRGPLPILMPFGMANYVFATLDFKSAAQIVRSHWTLAMRSRGVPTPYGPSEA